MDLGEGDLEKGVFLPYFRLFENGGGAGGGKKDFELERGSTENVIEKNLSPEFFESHWDSCLWSFPFRLRT
jgi:hypothetical protein